MNNLPELTPEEKQMIDSIIIEEFEVDDITPILGTPSERLRFALDKAIQFMRERDSACKERDKFREAFIHAIECVDKVFQSPNEIIPNFLKLGEDKFEGVIKLAEAYKQLKKEVDTLRDQINVLYHHSHGDFWIWQNDGEDHLESLCSEALVQIRAGQLRNLLAKAATNVR